LRRFDISCSTVKAAASFIGGVLGWTNETLDDQVNAFDGSKRVDGDDRP
jgi:hypothetical protein